MNIVHETDLRKWQKQREGSRWAPDKGTQETPGGNFPRARSAQSILEWMLVKPDIQTLRNTNWFLGVEAGDGGAPRGKKAALFNQIQERRSRAGQRMFS